MRTVCGTIMAGLSLCCSGVFASEYDVAAYVWPAYQPELRWAELGIFGEGIGEWQNVKEAVPKWDGHRHEDGQACERLNVARMSTIRAQQGREHLLER